jgi:prophage antirepressor-like protein
MENKLEIIKEQEVLGKQFRIYGTFDEPLFLAKDVAEWIDYSKSNGKYKVSQMLSTVDDDEKGIYIVDTLGGAQEMWFLTEDGLYEVLMQSRKPIAKQFKKKVKAILKEIRKTGSYTAKPLTTVQMFSIACKALEEHEQKLLQPYMIETQAFTPRSRTTGIPSAMVPCSSATENTLLRR